MTKEITKSVILQEIQDKFKLREFAASKFLFDETVIPVYNIEPHLERWKSSMTEKAVGSAAAIPFLTVPENEKWTFWRYDVVFMSATYTVAGVYTRRHDMPVDDFCYLDLGVAKSVSYHINLPVPVVLTSGDKLAINVDGFTSGGNLRLYMDYMLEEIR